LSTELPRDFPAGFSRTSFTQPKTQQEEAGMTAIRRIETYLSPKDAERFMRQGRGRLTRYARHGLLTQYRTDGGHRRYALSELRALRARQKTKRAVR